MVVVIVLIVVVIVEMMICKQTQSVIDPVELLINTIAITRICKPASLLVVLILYLSQLIFDCIISGPI